MRRLVLLPCLLALGHATWAQQARFTPLGQLPGGKFESYAQGISGDGTRVVGSSAPLSGREAVFWDVGVGIVGMGDLVPGIPASGAGDASFDGSVIVGAGSGPEAFRWRSGVMTGLGSLPGGVPLSNATAVSADGAIVVGASSSSSGYEAFRWSATGGMQGLGFLPGGGSWSAAGGVSADGSVVVGTCTTPAGWGAFRWTAGSGMTDLGATPGGFRPTSASAVSANGVFVVGSGDPGGHQQIEAFVWSRAGGLTALGDLPGMNVTSYATDVSADGSVIVGSGTSFLRTEAVLWSPAGGPFNLRLELVAAGVSGLDNWQLVSAHGVSDDGTVIVGRGINPLGDEEAWIAMLPRASSPTATYCAAKLNSLGCLPAIAPAGVASATNASPFVASVSLVRNRTPGLFLYKVNGAQASVPFQGGTLCVGPAGIRRTPISSSGGNPPPANDCSGVYRLDFNAFAAGLAGGNPDPALSVIGNVYHTQIWGRDQGFSAPNNTTLSDGLEVTIGA